MYKINTFFLQSILAVFLFLLWALGGSDALNES